MIALCLGEQDIAVHTTRFEGSVSLWHLVSLREVTVLNQIEKSFIIIGRKFRTRKHSCFIGIAFVRIVRPPCKSRPNFGYIHQVSKSQNFKYTVLNLLNRPAYCIYLHLSYLIKILYIFVVIYSVLWGSETWLVKYQGILSFIVPQYFLIHGLVHGFVFVILS